MVFKKILLVYNPAQSLAEQTAKVLAEFLHTRDCVCTVLSGANPLPADIKADLCISLGGDGTALRCTRYTAPLHFPVLAVNCGHLGFLSACDAAEALPILTQILAGDYEIHHRWLLEADIVRGEKPIVQNTLAFNDCVIKATQPRAFALRAHRDGIFFKQFYGDGVIVSTPTGSTAYSLSAGGPIVEPQLDVWTLTSICPHSLADRPLLLNAKTALTFVPVFKSETDTAAVSLDGQENFILQNGDSVNIRRSKDEAQLITPKGFDFFGRLRQKLEWGKR